MGNLLHKIGQSLANPLVITSLVLGILGAPPLWFSGIYLGRGDLTIGGLLFAVWVVIYTLDALVTLTLIVNRN